MTYNYEMGKQEDEFNTALYVATCKEISGLLCYLKDWLVHYIFAAIIICSVKLLEFLLLGCS